MIDAPAAEPRNRHAALAVATLFFVNGATFSNWLPRVPEIRDHLGLGNTGLGATLLGGGLGGIVGSVLVGRAMESAGSKRLVITAASLLSIGVPLIAFAPHAIVLLVLLTALGMLDVFNDVAMNAQGVTVQGRLGRSIMNRLHAMWSLGFTGGALLGSAAAAADIGIRVHLTIVGAVLLASVWTVQRWLIPVDPPAEPHDEGTAAAGTDGRVRRLSPVVLAMSVAALGAAVLEVMPNDWASVFMRDVHDLGRASGFGTVACAGAMLVGRLSGDHVLDRVGERRLLNGALVLVAAGTVLTVVSPFAAGSFAGLVVWGLGLSVVFPQLYARAARLPGTSAGAGLGSMLLGQRLGGMLTAVSVGSLADWQGLRWAFAVAGAVAFALLVGTSHRTSHRTPRAVA